MPSAIKVHTQRAGQQVQKHALLFRVQRYVQRAVRHAGLALHNFFVSRQDTGVQFKKNLLSGLGGESFFKFVKQRVIRRILKPQRLSLAAVKFQQRGQMRFKNFPVVFTFSFLPGGQ